MKNNKLDILIRRDIAEMEAYVAMDSLWDLCRRHGQKIENVIKLDAGENQFGFSPRVLTALQTGGLFNFYPDPEYKALRQALARYCHVSDDAIMVGSGSDELLDLLLRLVLDPGEKIINCPPTFAMYPVLAKLNKGRLISVNRRDDFTLDVDNIKRVLDQKVKIIIVCSPNNPTGTVSSKSEIITLLKTQKLVIVDEAYFEFSGKTMASLIPKYPNLIVLRTLSKWAGLAGLRLGYGIMDPFFVKQLLKIKSPYNVNLAASIAGIAALKDKKWGKRSVQLIIKERQRLELELKKIPNYTVYPSGANSLFIKVGINLSKLRALLENNYIAVRYYEPYQAIRLSIGTKFQNNKILAILKEFAVMFSS